MLECHAEGTRAEFRVNDLPVIVRGDGDGLGRYWAGPVNHLLVEGENDVTIVVEPGPTPSTALGRPGERRARRALPGASASCKLVRYREGMVVGDPKGVTLAAVEWEASDAGGALPYPQVASATAALKPGHGRWRWEDAPRAAPDRPAIEALLRKVAAALEAGDADAFLALTRARTTELARAYGRTLADKEAELRRLVVDDASGPHRGVQPLAPETWDLRPIARGRVLDCVRQDGRAILLGPPRPPEGFCSTYDVRVALLDGAWQVVR